MKRHYYGLEHGISTESLSFTEVCVFTDENSVWGTTLLSVEARICRLEPASLCLRIQRWELIDPMAYDWLHNSYARIYEDRFMSICDHLRISTFSETSGLIRLKLKAQRTENLEDQEGTVFLGDIHKYRYCNTDFQIEIKTFRNGRSAFVYTKWLDLGAGLTPMDIQWRVHTGLEEYSQPSALGEAGMFAGALKVSREYCWIVFLLRTCHT